MGGVTEDGTTREGDRDDGREGDDVRERRENKKNKSVNGQRKEGRNAVPSGNIDTDIWRVSDKKPACLCVKAQVYPSLCGDTRVKVCFHVYGLSRL